MIKKDIYIKRNHFKRGKTTRRFLPEQRTTWWFSVLVAFVLLFTSASAQESSEFVKVFLNRDRVLIGEPIAVHVEFNTRQSRPVTKWFDLPDSFNHLEVLLRSPVDSTYTSNGITYHQVFTVTGFEPGVWTIPAMEMITGKKKMYTDSLPVTIIAAVLKDSAYHDIREIIAVPPSKTSWWYYLAGMFILAMIVLLTVLWIKRRGSRMKWKNNGQPTIPPLEEALEQLRSLTTEPFIDPEDWKRFYSQLTEIFKIYMEKKFAFPALQKTTGEILIFLHTAQRKGENQEVMEVLRLADAVKFAKYQPDPEASENSRRVMIATLKALDQINL